MTSRSVRKTSCILDAPLSRAGGASVTGIDLAQPLAPTAREEIAEAFRDFSFVVFPGQRLSREEQFKFVANFGEIEAHGAGSTRAKRYETAHVISNLDAGGNPVDRSSSPVSNYRWHTDKAYHRVPPKLTALYAVELPPCGGDTEIANTAMGYAALPEATKWRLAGLRVVFYWGAGARDAAEATVLGAERQQTPVDHPLVRTHPETGKKALYLGNHASHIVGMPETGGRALLDELLAHTTKPEFVYSHRWRIGDLLMWDNRCLLHRAVANYEIARYRRVLHRSVVRGTMPF